MAKRSSKTSYVLNVIKNAGGEDEPAEELKPSWMAPGEFQETLQDNPGQQSAAEPVESDLQTELKKQFSDPPDEQPAVSERNSRLRRMIGRDSVEDDVVSDKIRASLESYLKSTFSDKTDSPQEDRPPIIIEGDRHRMTHDEDQNKLSPLGDSFTYNEPDTIRSELQNTSLADDNDPSAAGTQSDEYIFVNVAEEIVRSKVPPIMNEYKMCTCERCTNDVVALTLNNIAPRYVVTKKGKLYARINACLPQYQADLLEAIGNACLAVKSNSRHTQTPQD